MSSQNQNKAEVHINVCPQTLGFVGKARQLVDLSPSDFYLYGHLRTTGLSTPIENEEKLRQHIFYVRQSIRNNRGISEMMRQSTVRRVRACIDSHKEFFELLL
jgi:hypothetical protein